MHYVPQRYQESDDSALEGISSFSGMSIHDFMSSTSAYEDIPAPFSPFLRRSTQVGMVLILIAACIIALLPNIEDGIHVVAFPFLLQGLNEHLEQYIHWLAHTPLISYIDALLLCAGLVLMIVTRNLRHGTTPQNWLAFAIAVGGTINLLLMLAAVLLFLPNLIMWLLLVGGILVIIVVLLRAAV